MWMTSCSNATSPSAGKAHRSSGLARLATEISAPLNRHSTTPALCVSSPPQPNPPARLFRCTTWFDSISFVKEVALFRNTVAVQGGHIEAWIGPLREESAREVAL